MTTQLIGQNVITGGPVYFTAGTSSTISNCVFYNTSNSSTLYISPPNGEIELGRTYEMPDGSKLYIDDLGNYRVEDSKAKVTYRANRVREFNPYISASDLLEHFINEVGVMDGVDQNDVLRLPIEAFINWLILQAAKRDGDRIEGLPTVEQALPMLALPNPARVLLPRCGLCGRFIRRAWAQARIAFCSPEHMQLRLARIA